MKQETLKLKPQFIGEAIYDGFEAGSTHMNKLAQRISEKKDKTEK